MYNTEMKLIVGLGNLGRDLEKTRHNVGFLFLDYVYGLADIRIIKKWRQEKALEAEIAQVMIGEDECILAKPQTYMNDSGRAVKRLLAHFPGIDAHKDLLVVYDDIETPLGRWKVKTEGSAGGHNGIRSIIAHIGHTFTRYRVGVGRPTDDTPVHEYVLSQMKKAEQERLLDVFAEISEGI